MEDRPGQSINSNDHHLSRVEDLSGPTRGIEAAKRRRETLLLQHDPTATSNQHLALDPFIVIPQPGHVHSMTATPCMSYLLTGSEDGYVRLYDFWASANGKNMLSTQQRSMATLGEGVNKGGVVKGYYRNEAEMEQVVGDSEEDAQAGGPALPWMQNAPSQSTRETIKVKKMQPVYSMAVQSDGLWAASGTESGVINLATLRHDPGKIVHTFDTTERHVKPVSALLLTTDEQYMFSGSWDKQIKVGLTRYFFTTFARHAHYTLLDSNGISTLAKSFDHLHRTRAPSPLSNSSH